MQTNRNGCTGLDWLVSAEVRAEIARNPSVSVSSIARRLDMRRATLSERVNGHAAFTPSLLSEVASELGTTAAELVARAEERAAQLASIAAKAAA